VIIKAIIIMICKFDSDIFLEGKSNLKYYHQRLIDWCCFYYSITNSIVALLEALCALELCQSFWQESGINWALFLTESVPKKNAQAQFSIAVSAAKIWKSDISSASEKAFPGIWGGFLCVFTLAKTRCLELTESLPWEWGLEGQLEVARSYQILK